MKTYAESADVSTPDFWKSDVKTSVTKMTHITQNPFKYDGRLSLDTNIYNMHTSCMTAEHAIHMSKIIYMFMKYHFLMKHGRV